MKISILTPSCNQGKYIAETIESVLSQNDLEFEHIVIDGGSTDETLPVLKRYPHLQWVSEKDKGQADALQKGLARSTGDIIGWINSDDYYEPGAFAAIREVFEDPSVAWVVGNLSYLFDASGSKITDASPIVTHEALIRDPDIVRQQPTFFRRDFLVRAGGWDAQYHMTMDYDLWTRLARLAAPRMIEANLACFRFHKDQKTTKKNILTQLRELTEIMRREGARHDDIKRVLWRKQILIAKLQVKSFLIRTGLLPEKYQSQPLRTRRV